MSIGSTDGHRYHELENDPDMPGELECREDIEPEEDALEALRNLEAKGRSFSLDEFSFTPINSFDKAIKDLGLERVLQIVTNSMITRVGVNNTLAIYREVVEESCHMRMRRNMSENQEV